MYQKFLINNNLQLMINNAEFQDEIGENHIATNAQNPIRKDAFSISDEDKISLIKKT